MLRFIAFFLCVFATIYSNVKFGLNDDLFYLFACDDSMNRVLKIDIPKNFKKAFEQNPGDYCVEFIPQNESLDNWSEIITLMISNTKKPLKDIVQDNFKITQANNIPSFAAQSESRLIGKEEGYFHTEKLGEQLLPSGIFIPMKDCHESMQTHYFKFDETVYILQYTIRHLKQISKIEKDQIFKRIETFLFENCKVVDRTSIPDWEKKTVHFTFSEKIYD